MAATPEHYLAVLKASYDYEPQPDATDEIAIKEDQLLFLLEKTDDECVASNLLIRHLVADVVRATLAGGKSRSSSSRKMKRVRLAWCLQPTWNL